MQVPVQARVGNGEVSVQLQLRSRTLEPIGGPQVVDVNVRADWEGVGIVVLSLLVGGFIVLGVVRTVLRLRSRRGRQAEARAVAADAEKDAEGGSATDAAAEAVDADAVPDAQHGAPHRR